MSHSSEADTVRADDAVLPDEAQFAAEARAFLDAHAMPKTLRQVQWGLGDDAINVIDEPDPDEEARRLGLARQWRATLFDAGLGWITGPRAYGGRGLPRAYERCWRRIEAQYDVPDQTPMLGGLTVFGPTLLANATEEVKHKYLRAIYRGDVVACQLFSEPGAGSDIAAISTRARRDGDDWVISGQKVWTSNARLADIAELFVRTSTDKPRHRGLTAFVIDMRSPGIEIRPIRQMTGGASFNEVFLNDVRVPDSHRLSDVDDGWRVVLESLQLERFAVGLGAASPDYDPMGRLRQLIVHMGRAKDPLIRQRFAQAYGRDLALRLTTQRYAEGMEHGDDPGSKVALTKLMFAQNTTAIGELAAAVLGPRLIADTREWGTYAWSNFLLGAPAMHLGGGTDQIMRNTLAEHVLGLPRDPR